MLVRRPLSPLPSLAAALLAGCARADLDVEPEAIDWGEVDFLAEMPDGGYAPVDLAITNGGDAVLHAVLAEFDFDHLCAPGFAADRMPAELPPLDPGQTYAIPVGACAYSAEGGERDTEVSGAIVITADGSDPEAEIPWSFVPVLGLDED